MNLQKIKDHFPEYSDMKLGEFFKYMHKKYYSQMKITDMYKSLLKLTEIVKKEEVEEDVEVEEVEVETGPKKEDTAIAELKEAIVMLTQKIGEMSARSNKDEDTIKKEEKKEVVKLKEEPPKEEKDLDKITVITKAVYNDRIIPIEMNAKEAMACNKEAMDCVDKMLECIANGESLGDVLKKHDVPKEYRNKVKKQSKQLQKEGETTLEANEQAIKQLLEIYQKEKRKIDKQIGGGNETY